MSKITIEDTVYIDAKLLDKNLNNHIYHKLCDKFIKTFHPVYGLILKIYEGITVVENVTSSSATGVFFCVSFQIKAFFPKIGDVFTGKITKMIPAGMDILIKNDILIFVSYLELQKIGHKFNSITRSFASFKLEDTIEVTIKNMKYEKQKYIYLGSVACQPFS